MEPNTNKTAVTLEQMLDSHRRSNAKIAAVAKQVAGLGAAGISKIEDAMYQMATRAQYTKAVETEITMADATVGTLLDDEALAALTPAGTDGEGNSQYAFLINGVQTGTYTKDSKLSDILAGISNSEEAGVDASYSDETGKFVFTAKKYGADQYIDIGEGLADTLFGPPAGSDKSDEKFAVVYNEPNMSEFPETKVRVSAKVGSSIYSTTVTWKTLIRDLTEDLTSASGQQLTFYYDRYLGEIAARDPNGKLRDVVLLKELGGEFKSAEKRDCYVKGRDAVFTAIRVNGKNADIIDKTVDISVPTRTSLLENDKNFQTKEQVAAAVAGASHLKRKKVASVDAIDTSAADADQYIYMVAKAGAKNGDKYDEYMVLDGEVEKVGDWAVDLSGFQQAEEGKGLSTNDFSNEYKDKLDGLTFAPDEEVAAALAEIYGTDEA